MHLTYCGVPRRNNTDLSNGAGRGLIFPLAVSGCSLLHIPINKVGRMLPISL
jgi:hypothetical protein